MKKVWCLVLSVLLLVSLCACDPAALYPTAAPDSDANYPATAPTGTEASCAHTYEESITKESTCVEAGEKTYQCTKCSHSYTETMDIADHTWVDATCIASKYCHVCNLTEGDLGDHNYIDGVCSICDKEASFGSLNGTWFLEGVSAEYNEYEQMRLFFLEEDSAAHFSASFYHLLNYETQEELDFILENGYIERNGYREYFYDVTEFNGQYYHSAMFGTTAAGTYKQNGNLISIDLVSYYGGEGVLTLQRISETILKVVSIDDVVCDELVSDIILGVGQFTYIEDQGIG